MLTRTNFWYTITSTIKGKKLLGEVLEKTVAPRCALNAPRNQDDIRKAFNEAKQVCLACLTCFRTLYSAIKQSHPVVWFDFPSLANFQMPNKSWATWCKFLVWYPIKIIGLFDGLVWSTSKTKLDHYSCAAFQPRHSRCRQALNLQSRAQPRGAS